MSVSTSCQRLSAIKANALVDWLVFYGRWIAGGERDAAACARLVLKD